MTLVVSCLTMRKTRHYAVLDGMRGLAALAVVISHAGSFFGSYQPRSAYLAVDVFFLLSGFVIAHAYGRKMADTSLSLRSFMLARILRLYPLYAAGTALTLLAALTAILITKDAATWEMGDLGASGLLAFLMLPSHSVGIPDAFFPLNFPAWSLFYEMLVNIGYAICRGNVRGWLFGPVIIVSAMGILVQCFKQHGVNQGALWVTTAWALARVFYSFPLGVLLYRFHRRITWSAGSGWLLCGVLVASLWLDPSGIYRSIYDAIFVLVLSPAIVLLGSVAGVGGGQLNRVFLFLGAISYPIYALHDPFVAVVSGISRRVFPGLTTPALKPWSGVCVVIALILLSWFASKADAVIRRQILIHTRRPIRSPTE